MCRSWLTVVRDSAVPRPAVDRDSMKGPSAQAAGTAVRGSARRAPRAAAVEACGLRSRRRRSWAFAATTVAMALTVLSIFTELYPNVMVSSTSPAYNLTISNTASNSYSLRLMTIVVVIFLPVVLLYQGWTYYVFRRRVSRQEFQPPAPSPEGAPKPTPQPAVPPVGPGS